MTDQQLISHLNDCRRHLADLRARQNYVALTCAMLRLEGNGGTILYDQPFARTPVGRPFHDRLSISHGETFAIAFFAIEASIEAERIPVALSPVETITGELHPLLRVLPKLVRERLQLPESDNWWRIVFHIAWHFPRPFLNATRRRLLAKDGAPAGVSDETFVQTYGVGGRTDLLPGLIYSKLEHDLCTCSEAAISVVLDALEKHAQTDTLAEPEALSVEQRRKFDQLRVDFEAGAQMPMGLECKLLKLADSFESPPAIEWAHLEVGGCVERFLTLSKLNDQQEIVQIRGPATKWFCQVAERAGNTLPTWIPDRPILFDDRKCGFSGPTPVMNRDACQRWVGFVLATVKQHAPDFLRVSWGTAMGPLSYGLATLDRNLCAASVLAIDLARLTTSAAEMARQERATCSPFTVPSMEEQGFRWAEAKPPPTPPANYTLGQLVEDLRRFGEDYHGAADRIREENPMLAKQSRIQLGANVSGARACLLAIPGFSELRAWARSEWDEEISFAAGSRIVDTLVERSHGRLSVDSAKGLSLSEAVARLSSRPADLLEKEGLQLSSNELPAPTDPETRQRVIDELENWKRILYASPAEKPTLQEHVETTRRILAWRDRYAIHFDVNPLDEVRRILMRRATGEQTPEDELRTAGEGAARVCDCIKEWLQTLADGLEGLIPALGDNMRTVCIAKADVVLITVNEHETQAVYTAFREATGSEGVPISLEGRLYNNLGTLNDTTVYHAISEIGSGGAGAMQQAVDKAIRALRPGAVIAVGIAFGVNEKDQTIGDILLSKQLRSYELQRAGPEIKLRGDKAHASTRLINHFETFCQIKWKGAKVWPGVILSGEKLIDNINYRDQLLKLESEAVGGEMEGAGLYVSSHDHKVDWIVIKAICDWADSNKEQNKTESQRKAAKNAVDFLIQALQYAPLKLSM